jgi:beta-lactam-binding protein with PASTA domain
VTRPGAARPKPARTAAIVAGLVVLLALAGVLIWFLSRGVTVIDLTDWTTSDALLWARSNGLNLQLEERYDDVFAEGRILAQQPTQGARLNKGEFVKITVSLGHDLSVLLDLPDLMTMTMSEIETWAAENFLTKVRITTEYHAEITAGRVIRYEINDNTVVDQVRRSTPILSIMLQVNEILLPSFR